MEYDTLRKMPDVCMVNDFIVYKRAFEDSSQNALLQYMVDYFTDRYDKRMAAYRYHHACRNHSQNDVCFHAGASEIRRQPVYRAVTRNAKRAGTALSVTRIGQPETICV